MPGPSLVFTSIEIRWFHKGSIPEAVQVWFDGCPGYPLDQPAREDHYLFLPSQDDLGLKLRQGRIEVKQLQDQYGSFRCHQQITGMLERWRKWSFPLARATELHQILSLSDSDWIPVYKERVLRRYSLKQDGKLVSAMVGEEAETGCEVELTKVQIRDQVWWSLAFEAYGKLGDGKRVLSLTTQELFLSGDPPVLSGSASFGYPEWLRRCWK